MNPHDAVRYLYDVAKWSEQRIAQAVGCRQTTIHRIKHGATPSYTLGDALIRAALTIKGAKR